MKYLSCVLIIVVVSINIYAQRRNNSASQPTFNSEKIFSLSLIRLIAAPEKYNGKYVRVHGYMHLEFEGDKLYLHQEDFKHQLCYNAVRLIFSTSEHLVLRRDSSGILVKCYDLVELNNKYVDITARFKACEQCGTYSGILKEIDAIDAQN